MCSKSSASKMPDAGRASILGSGASRGLSVPLAAASCGRTGVEGAWARARCTKRAVSSGAATIRCLVTMLSTIESTLSFLLSGALLRCSVALRALEDDASTRTLLSDLTMVVSHAWPLSPSSARCSGVVGALKPMAIHEDACGR